MLERVLWEH